MPLIVLDHKPNFLARKLESLGYTNLVRVRDGETVAFREFNVSCYAPFAKHNFHECEVGNLIDSALIVECNGVSALNANDNTPTVETAQMLREKFGEFDLAMLNYNAAGPYPSCFDNLSQEEKVSEHHRILRRNFDLVVSLLDALEPRAFLPFAGAYVLGGKERHKNEYLGTTTWDECAEYVSGLRPDLKCVTLREGTSYDLQTQESDRDYQRIDTGEMKRYIEEELASIEYPYEGDERPDADGLLADLEKASAGMKGRMERFGIRSDCAVSIDVFGRTFQIYPEFSEVSDEPAEKRLECRLDERILARILSRSSHWNNAEIGGHINFVRVPNVYQPDLHTGLQFLHL